MRQRSTAGDAAGVPRNADAQFDDEALAAAAELAATAAHMAACWATSSDTVPLTAAACMASSFT